MDEYVTILSTNYCLKPSEAHFYVKNIMELNPSVQELRAVKRKIKAALRNRPELCNAIFAAFGHYERPHPKFYKLITLVTATSLWHFLANTAATNTTTDCPFHRAGFFIALTLHMLYVIYNINTMNRKIAAWFNIYTIILGAFALMGTKPNPWFFSLKWNCPSPVNERAALMSYSFIVLGTTEYIMWTGSIEKFFELRGVTEKWDLQRWITLGITGVLLLTACWIMTLIEAWLHPI